MQGMQRSDVLALIGILAAGLAAWEAFNIVVSPNEKTVARQFYSWIAAGQGYDDFEEFLTTGYEITGAAVANVAPVRRTYNAYVLRRDHFEKDLWELEFISATTSGRGKILELKKYTECTSDLLLSCPARWQEAMARKKSGAMQHAMNASAFE